MCSNKFPKYLHVRTYFYSLCPLIWLRNLGRKLFFHWRFKSSYIAFRPPVLQYDDDLIFFPLSSMYHFSLYSFRSHCDAPRCEGAFLFRLMSLRLSCQVIQLRHYSNSFIIPFSLLFSLSILEIHVNCILDLLSWSSVIVILFSYISNTLSFYSTSCKIFWRLIFQVFIDLNMKLYI